jgi:hypothetical protein
VSGDWSGEGAVNINQLVGSLVNLPRWQPNGQPPIVTPEVKQGVYVSTPQGELLEWVSSGGSSMPGVSYTSSVDVVRFMEGSLKKWGKPARPAANQAVGALLGEKDYVAKRFSDDSIVLRAVTRDLPRKVDPRAGKTKWSVPEFREDWNLNYAEFASDQVQLSLPEPLTIGAKKYVMGDVIFFLARDYLVDNVHGTPPPPDGAKVKRSRLTAEVVGIANGVASLRLEGATLASTADFGYDAQILGRASYDLNGKKWIALELVAVGSRRGAVWDSGRGPWQNTPVDSGPAPMGIVCTLVGGNAPSEGEVVSLLAERTKDPNARVRWAAAQAIGTMKLGAKAAVSDLGPLLNDESRDVRAAAAEALGKIGPASKDTVPALTKALTDTVPFVRREAATALGGIGPDASSAVPTLVDLLNGNDQGLQDAVMMALENISPGLESKVPVLKDVRDRRASAGGKYADLARRLHDAEQMESVSIFQDAGLREGISNYRGHKDLPAKGYWVYLYPYWYIWGDQTKQ